MEVPIHYIAVVGAAVASMVLGFLWYGPLFGKMWIALSGFTQDQMNAAKKKGLAKQYGISLGIPEYQVGFHPEVKERER